MATVTTSDIWEALRDNLEEVQYDDANVPPVYTHWCESKDMEHAYEDVTGVVGPGLLAEKNETGDIAPGTVALDFTERYIPRGLALKLMFSHEVVRDNKQKRALDAGYHLHRSAKLTREYQMTSMLEFGNSALQPMADGQPVWSTAHVLNRNSASTFSNQFATAMGASTGAILAARTMATKMPGRDGLVGNHSLTSIVFPVDQLESWEVATMSKKKPGAGEFNAINVVADMKLELVPNRFWQGTTTDYCFNTDADGGWAYREREKLYSFDWLENGSMTLCYAVYMCFAAGIPNNARSTIGVNF
jgi:hypothetical protein